MQPLQLQREVLEVVVMGTDTQIDGFIDVLALKAGTATTDTKTEVDTTAKANQATIYAKLKTTGH